MRLAECLFRSEEDEGVLRCEEDKGDERGGSRARTHTCITQQCTGLTSKVISRTFLGICMTPESPISPATQTHGLDVVMALLSFLMGIITARYGITEKINQKKNKKVI